MAKELSAPRLDGVLHCTDPEHRGFRNEYARFTQGTNECIDDVFRTLEKLESHGDRFDSARSIWMRLPRGTIEEFGSYESYLEWGEVKNYDEFVRLWKCEYPSPYQWYEITMAKSKNGYRALYANSRVLVIQGPDIKYSYWELDESELFSDLNSTLEMYVEMVSNGTYHGFVERNLPYKYRSGRILRKDLWEIDPTYKEWLYDGRDQKDIDGILEFLESVPDEAEGRLPNMTAGDYLRFCSICYRSAGFDIGDLDEKGQYHKYSYNSDQGLLDLDSDSPEVFETWIKGGPEECGHYHRIVGGGSFTSTSLFVSLDEGGYSLTISCPCDSDAVNTVMMYRGLTMAGIPVGLDYGDSLRKRFRGEDDIGIVPFLYMTYAYRWHNDGGVYCHIHLPLRNRNRIISKTRWKPIRECRITSDCREPWERESEQDEISKRNEGGMESLSDCLRSFAGRYPAARKEPFKGNPTSDFLRKEIVARISGLGLFPPEDYKVLGSVGKGGWAEIPWLAVFDNDETTTLHHGQFIIMVLSADYSRIFFSLNHGSVTFFDRHNRRETNEYLQNVASTLAEKLDAPGFEKGRIDLGASSSVGRFLELGNILSHEYVLSNLDDSEIVRTLEELKSLYSRSVALERAGLVTLAYPDNADIV